MEAESFGRTGEFLGRDWKWVLVVDFGSKCW
jgi:hypothetical protein